MVREIKRQARSILLKNYKLFLLPTVLCIFANFVAGLLDFPFDNETALKTNFVVENILHGMFLAFSTCLFSLSVFFIFKVAVPLVDEETYHERSGGPHYLLKDMITIIIIHLIPNMLNVMRSLLDGFIEHHEVTESVSFVISFISFVFGAILLYLDYKFFACHYYYVLKRDTIKHTIALSFATMKKTVWKYFLLTFSFAPWYIAVIVLAQLFSNIFDISDFGKNILFSSGCGLYLYLLPYEYTAYSLFIKRVSGNNCK